MYVIKQTDIFKQWLKVLKDPIARIMITKWIERAKQGNLGDHKMLGGGISELRIDSGKGYRIYYTQIDTTIYFLLNGGDKSSQQNDIIKARTLLDEMKKYRGENYESLSTRNG